MTALKYYTGSAFQTVGGVVGPQGPQGAAWAAPHPGTAWHLDYPQGVTLGSGWLNYQTGTFTASVAGIYLMEHNVTIVTVVNAAGYVAVNYTPPAGSETPFYNGAIRWHSQGTAQNFHMGFASTAWLPVGDTVIRMYAQQDALFSTQVWNGSVCMNLVVPSA